MASCPLGTSGPGAASLTQRGPSPEANHARRGRVIIQTRGGSASAGTWCDAMCTRALPERSLHLRHLEEGSAPAGMCPSCRGPHRTPRRRPVVSVVLWSRQRRRMSAAEACHHTRAPGGAHVARPAAVAPTGGVHLPDSGIGGRSAERAAKVIGRHPRRRMLEWRRVHLYLIVIKMVSL